ncbi:MAG: DUF58 domain-containing protein [Kiritimatiellae bacterium]|nr:DUF58 domain-containing protein [Kiritimatiellia bacterium]
MSTGLRHYLTPLQMQRLARLTLQSRDVVEGTLAGRHRSPARGASTEFADHRQYMPGDDLKRLDWKVLGRTERYYIRRYQDETNLRVYLVVDRSASMNFGTTGTTKYHYACQLAAALGYVVLRSRDSVGLHVYSTKMDVSVPARNSMLHLNNCLKTLQHLAPAGTTGTAAALHQIADGVHRRAMVVVLSDLLDDREEIVKAFAHFRKLRHDVIVFQVLDPVEVDLSMRRGAEFEDLETGERLAVDPRAVADAYREVFGEFLEGYRKACAEMRIDYRMASPKMPVDTFVRAFLEERKRLSR